MSTKGKVLVAMSGGVDSTVAALLLKEKGYDVIGITMKTWDYESSGGNCKETGCCSLDSIQDARAMAVKFDFPHYVVDLRKEFEEKIISNFIAEYLAGRTPNPCVLCNRLIKWEDLLKKADQLGCKYIATGHYAKVLYKDERWYLQRGADREKDQTYVLWGLSQENLNRTLLPLSEYNKSEVKKIARDNGLDHIAEKSESFEICFIPDDDYRGFLKRKLPDLEKKMEGGEFVNTDGKVLGTHNGYPFYTIGQRKGLVIAVGHPLYVNRLDPKKNQVVLGTKEDLNRDILKAGYINLMKYPTIDGMKNVTTCIRYHDKGELSSVLEINGELEVKFDNPVQGITPGQSVVFYEGDDLLGGGIILV
jgi:tRNA-uridine 2-sulfurtransferase